MPNRSSRQIPQSLRSPQLSCAFRPQNRPLDSAKTPHLKAGFPAASIGRNRRDGVMMRRGAGIVAAMLSGLAPGILMAGEGLYEFAAVPSLESNSFYRLNTATGEIT